MTARREISAVKIVRMTGNERLNNSVNGNPRYLVTFDDGTAYRTSPDASCAYGLNNSENWQHPLFVQIDGRNNITYLHVATADEIGRVQS